MNPKLREFEERVKAAATSRPSTPPVMTNNVDHPSHYNQGGIETIDYIESALTEAELSGFMKGNIIKYVSREVYKNGVEDLKKAKWYLDRLIDQIEKSNEKR